MHRMIRPLFAPFYQAWMCIGFVLAALAVVLVGSDGGAGLWRRDFDLVTSPLGWLVVILNSLVAARIYLMARKARLVLTPGPISVYAFLAIAAIEGFVAALTTWDAPFATGGIESIATSLIVAMFAFVIVSALGSIVWYPVGKVVERVAEPILKHDPTLDFGRFDAGTR